MKTTPLAVAALLAALSAQEDQASDVADITSVEKKAGDDDDKAYFLLGYDEEKKAPKKGYKLLVILPGGDGGRGFETFCKRIRKYALDDEWIAVQLVAKQWTEEQRIVWPTEKTEVDEMEFTTEEFIDAVIDDVEADIELDRKFLFTLSWSSSGPACYAAALRKKSRITGSLIAMSVFKPDYLPDLKHAKKRAFYLYHSEEDRVCPFWMAEDAQEKLEKKKAKVELATYEGGHGWRGPVWPNLKSGIAWLVENHSKAVEHPKPARERR